MCLLLQLGLRRLLSGLEWRHSSRCYLRTICFWKGKVYKGHGLQPYILPYSSSQIAVLNDFTACVRMESAIVKEVMSVLTAIWKTMMSLGAYSFHSSSSLGLTCPCDDIDCGEHGTCENGKCVCKDGYFGIWCETNISFFSNQAVVSLMVTLANYPIVENMVDVMSIMLVYVYVMLGMIDSCWSPSPLDGLAPAAICNWLGDMSVCLMMTAMEALVASVTKATVWSLFTLHL